jgi:hypothetical protein
MIQANKRCVVFSDLREKDTPSKIPTAPDGWAKTWRFVRENAYGNDSLRPPAWVTQRPESKDADTIPGRTLTLLNHFPEWAVGTLLPADMSFECINDAEALEAHVDQWLIPYPRLPNFLAVDYVHIGTRGGPLTAVREINRRWANQTSRSDPPLGVRLVPNGRVPATVKDDLRNTSATDSLVAVVVDNMSDNDLTLLRAYARHGQIVDDLPGGLLGRLADPIRRVNGDGATACAGVSTVPVGMIGPQCFWLYSTPGTTKLLFIAVSSPYIKLFYKNYANAKWVDRTDAVNAFIANGSGGDALFDALFAEANDQTSDCADVRMRVRPKICSTWDMSNRTPGDMTVSIWSY